MFTKRKLLCTAAVCLAIGGMAGAAGAATLNQDNFTKTIEGTPTNGLTYDNTTGTVVLPGGSNTLSEHVDITQTSSANLSNNYGITIGSNATLTITGYKPDTPLTTGGLGYLNVAALFISGDLVVTASAPSLNTGEVSHGVIVHDYLTQSGGTVTLTGGSLADNDRAMGIAGNYNLTGGTLTAQGGLGSTTGNHALIVGSSDPTQYTDPRNFVQTGGNASATGGTNASHGIVVVGQVNISNGNMTATGGSTSSVGVAVMNNDAGFSATFIQSGGTVNAIGGTDGTSEGIYIYDDNASDRASYEMHGGTLNAQGTTAAGVTIEDASGTGAFNQSAGTVNATGGTAANVYGIDVENAYNLNGGTVNADGGTADGAHGILADNTFTQNGGTLTATGGTLTVAGTSAGVSTQSFTQNNGTIYAYGGGGNPSGTGYTAGISANNFLQAEGNIYAYGGAAGTTNAYGIYAGSFLQDNPTYYNAANFYAYGGAGVNAYGLYVAGSALIDDNFTAVSGEGLGAYGAYFNGGLTLDTYGWLEYEKASTTTNASVYVNGNLTANSGSAISPVINVGAGVESVGVINVTGTVDLNLGARFIPKFTNVLADDGSTKFGTGAAFIVSGGITGDFMDSDGLTTDGNTYNSLFYEYTVEKSGNNYVIKDVTQTATVADVLNTLGENTQRLINGITDGVTAANAAGINTEALSLLSDVFDTLANAQNMTEFATFANYAQLHLTNHGGTRLAAYNIQQLDVVQMAMNREISNAQKLPYWQVWTKGIFHSGDVDAKTHEFIDGKEDFSGIVIGAARDFRYVTFAGQAHYLTGKVKSKSFYKADADNFGFIVGMRIHDVVGSKEVFNPWFDVNFAYSHMSADQKRMTLGYDAGGNITTMHATSDAKSNLFRIGLAMGNTFKLGGIGTVTPQIGFDYTNIRFDGYTEHSAGMALKTGKTTYESLRPKIGAEAEIYISDYITADLRAFYYYETMDQRMTYNNSFVGAEMVRFKTKGEKFSRSSGNIGGGLNVHFNEQVSAGLAYDLWLRDKYMAHQLAVELRVNF